MVGGFRSGGFRLGGLRRLVVESAENHTSWRPHTKLKKTWVAEEDDTNGDGNQNGTEGKMRDDGSVSDATNDGW